MRRQQGFDFSFSGLKTAVAVALERDPGLEPADVAASFQRTAVDSLVDVTLRAAEHTGLRRLVVAGGVAANTRLRAAMASAGLDAAFPPSSLATDNGAMIALAAERRLVDARRHQDEALGADAVPYLPLADTGEPSASA